MLLPRLNRHHSTLPKAHAPLGVVYHACASTCLHQPARTIRNS